MHDHNLPDTSSLLPCEGKLCFVSRNEAQASATVLAYRHGQKLRVYKCRYCKWWHLSSGKD